ncbi:MAG: hypothetical protein RBT34_02115 [Anaerolineaceae bacterium]|jgi:hypothetical protein|nr:hypothetical protein [Anaerolineaceae bacterium]
MHIISNNKAIKRKTRIGQITTLAGLGVLAVGFVLSLNTENINLSFAALILGFVLTQIAIYHGNRWGKSPREDELLVKGLKGLGKQTTLYTFTTPVPYLVVGPMGVWIIIPYFHEGTITYNEKKGRWRQKSKNWYMRLFGQAGLGRPDQDEINQRTKLQQYFRKNLPENLQPEVNVALVFTAKNVKVEAADAPIPTFALDKVKSYLRAIPKDGPADPEIMAAVKELFPKESIS